MNIFQRIVFTLTAATSIGSLAFVPAVASATTTTSGCTVATVGTKNTAGAADSRFTINKDGTVTSTFKVTGDNCSVPVTIASWQAPNADKGRPYSEQKLFAHATGTFGAGVQTLTVALPDCYYQVDLVRGSSATDQNGGPEYDASVITGMGSLHGGTKVCTTPTPTPNPTPTPTPTPTTLPSTGTGSNIFVASVVTAIAGYAVMYFRKARASKNQA